MFFLSVLALLCMRSVALVNAALFILHPFKGSTCWAEQPCVVTWENDGVKPVLASIGVSTVALYNNQQLIQTLPPVNVETTSYFSFTPLPGAGPNSDGYYITFTSTKFNVSEDEPYRGYSPFFQLCGMSGSFNSPLPSATSSIPIPPSIEIPPTSSSTSTITVGTLSTSLSYSSSSPLPTPSVTSSVSGFSTSITQTSSASLSTTSAPATSNGSSSHLPRRVPVLFLALFSSFFFS